MFPGFRKFNLFIFLLLVLSISVYSQEEDEENKADKPVVPEYENIIDSSRFLHIHSYKDENIEHLILHKGLNNKKSASYYSNNKLKRFFYNESHRLSRVEYWTTGKTVKDSSLIKKQLYTYNEEDSGVSLVIEELDLVNKKLVKSYYDASNVPVKRDIYSCFDLEGETVKEPRIEYEFSYGYDGERRLILEKEKHYLYRTPEAKKVLKTVSRKNLYEYLRVDCPPVTSFYEDEVLRMKTVYSSENSYVQHIYFDNDNYVKVQYRDGKKVSEKFYAGGKEL